MTMHAPNEPPIALADEWGQGRIWHDAVRFARDVLNPALAAATGFPREAWRLAAEFGCMGLPMPVADGGRGATASAYAETLEALGYACPDNGFLTALCAHVLSCMIPLAHRGSAEQKERFLRPLCDGRMIAGHAATEPDAGSDIFSLRTTATPTADGYVLNGDKIFSLSAPAADVFFVFATLDRDRRAGGITVFLVERDRPGLTIGTPRRTIGMRTALMGDLSLRECQVPAANRLGPEGSGSMIFQLAMRWERTLIVAPTAGMLRRLVEHCVAYARARQQFGRPIAQFQSISNRIADMQMRADLARLALRQAAAELDRGSRDMLAPSISKLFISEAALQSSLDAVRIHGGRGFMSDCEYGADIADSLGLTILSGTSDIQRQIICRQLGLRDDA